MEGCQEVRFEGVLVVRLWWTEPKLKFHVYPPSPDFTRLFWKMALHLGQRMLFLRSVLMAA
jgi:hypothetical protein